MNALPPAVPIPPRMKRLLVLLVVLCCLAPAPALAWRGFVEEVLDGATLTVREEGSGRKVLVRLYGVAVPRLDGADRPQPFAVEAFEKTKELLPKDLPVAVHDMRLDAVGRERGFTVTLPGGRMVQNELLEAGLAWVAPLHCGSCRDWKKLEKRARAMGVGLWSDAAPVPPWEWP